MLLQWAVFLLSITPFITSSQPALSADAAANGIQIRTYDYVQIKTPQDDNSNHSHSNKSSLLWLKHIRHRRKNHHNEFAQQPTTIQLDSRSVSSRQPIDSHHRGLVREKRLLLNTTLQSHLNNTHHHHNHHQQQHNRHFNDSTTNSPTGTNIMATDSSTTSATILTTTTKSASNYNLSNSTDPYAFSAAEAHSFALPIEAQILMCILYGTLAFTAITSNMIVCYIVLSNQRMRTATNYFIVNLAVGDILMALLCIPFTFPANLVFQYWPFGLILCVVVSYSQANSVFISAYTMVAISIDKYLAIMYPMRVRMTKTQSKNIILVIWSAALITSLPTAILSRLSPAYVDLSTADSVPMDSQSQMITTTPSTVTTKHSAIAQEQNETNPSTPMSLLATTTTQQTEVRSARKQEEPFSWQNKYFCQESWTFWPKGKYYYSMALMILQFVVPLFVLVITYSRIVVVVWGKRIPGEEDNARDARMARSKRKMIKMVILCVIAFALTWLPFNALIVIGDMRPDIWEHQNIMYIWFTTHYLAMCHTITNPLIYIWMNNRFRAGFRQVISDLCKPIVHLFRYIWFHFCCLGCICDCSRNKYLQGVSRRELKRRSRNRPAGGIVDSNTHNNNPSGNYQTGSASATNNNNNNNSAINDGQKRSRVNHRLDSNIGLNNNNNSNENKTNNNNYDSHEPDGGGTGAQPTGSGGDGGTMSRNSCSRMVTSAPSDESCDVAEGTRVLKVGAGHQLLPARSSSSVDVVRITTDRANNRLQGTSLQLRVNFDENNEPRNSESHNGLLGGASRLDPSSIVSGGAKSIGASLRHRLSQFFLWRRYEIENGLRSDNAHPAAAVKEASSIDSRISSPTLLMSANSRELGFHKEKHNKNDNDGSEKGPQRKNKSKKRDKQSHVISIRMTAIDYYRKPASGGAGPSSTSAGAPEPQQQQPPALLKCQAKGHVTKAVGRSDASFHNCKLSTESDTMRKQSNRNSNQSEEFEIEAGVSRKKSTQVETTMTKTTITNITTTTSASTITPAADEVAPTATAAKLSIGRLISINRRPQKKKCPSCRAELVAVAETNTTSVPIARDSVAKLRKKIATDGEQSGKFVIDLHQSSQSTTPTNSTNQTNITSLVLSSMNSSVMSRDFVAATTTNEPAPTATNESDNFVELPELRSGVICNTAGLPQLQQIRCRLIANNGPGASCEHTGLRLATTETRSLSNVGDYLSPNSSNHHQHHHSEPHLVGAQGCKRETATTQLGRKNHLGPQRLFVSQDTPTEDIQNVTNLGGAGRAGQKQTLIGDISSAKDLDCSSFRASEPLFDVDIESGSLKMVDENGDHYCARHQRGDVNQPDGVIDDHCGTDEDVCDELLSSHRQQASRNDPHRGSQTNGSLDLLSDQSGVDLVDSEADLLVEYGDSDDAQSQANIFNLVRLNRIGRVSPSNNDRHRLRGKANDCADRVKSSATSINNLDAARRMHHLSRLFRSDGDDLHDRRHRNGQERFALRRARYRKLQSMANMVATTTMTTTTLTIATNSHSSGERLPEHDKDANDCEQGMDQIQLHRCHCQINFSVEASSRPLVLASQVASGSIQGRQNGGNIQFVREGKPNRQTDLRPLNIYQDEPAVHDERGVSRGGDNERQHLIPGGDKFGAKTRPYMTKAVANVVGSGCPGSRQVGRQQQQQQLVAGSRANERLVHRYVSNSTDDDDKTAWGLIYDSKEADSLENELNLLDDDAYRGDGGGRASGGDEPTIDRSSTSSSHTDLNLQLGDFAPTSPVGHASGGLLDDKVWLEANSIRKDATEIAVDSACKWQAAYSRGEKELSHGSLSCIQSAANRRKSNCLAGGQRITESQDAKLGGATLSAAVTNPNNSQGQNGTSLGWVSSNMACADRLSLAWKPFGTEFAHEKALSEPTFGSQLTVASVTKNDEIDMQSCRQTSLVGPQTAAVLSVAAMAAAAAAAATTKANFVADEKIPLSLSSSLLVRKSPTVYLINNKARLAKQPSLKTTPAPITTAQAGTGVG